MQKLNFAPTFDFYGEDLIATLCCHVTEESNGYFKIQSVSQADSPARPDTYLAVAKGKIVFAAQQPLTWQALGSQLIRYIPRLRSPSFIQAWQDAEAEINSGLSISTTLNELVSRDRLLTGDEVLKAIQIASLDLLDSYRSLEGKVTFQEDITLSKIKPIDGLSLQSLLASLADRWSQWAKLSHAIPSTQHVIVGNREKIECLEITENQRRHILSIVQHQHSIEQLAEEVGSNSLKIAQILEPLLKAGIASLKPVPQVPASIQETILSAAKPLREADGPKQVLTPCSPVKVDQVDIFVVDDSPMMLKQFEALVSSWSYSVRTCSQASKAVEQLLICHPSIIFVDINMPEMSGFQLLREIRLQPELSDIPVVILTAEESSSNIQKARWSKCDFLAKPINTQDIDSFGWDLHEILSNCESLAVA